MVHIGQELTLERVAEASGVGKYHLTRAFGGATGYPVMRYARGRRLTEAGRAIFWRWLLRPGMVHASVPGGVDGAADGGRGGTVGGWIGRRGERGDSGVVAEFWTAHWADTGPVVAVRDASRVGGEWGRVRLVAARYAVFRHSGHVSTVRRTWFTIWNGGGLGTTGEPEFELYGADFDGSTGFDGFEIWVPVAAE